MSEMKRVTLTTISDVVRKSPFGGALDQNTEAIFSGAFGGSGAASGKNGTAGGKPRKTVRLALELFEPTAQSFPEFNFTKLMREEQKRQRKVEKKITTAPNGFLSDADNDDDDVARIARELEKKYGSGTAYSSSGKSARSSQLDFCDRGAGYDEEDSFIDNTEAYDELIPEEVETVGGGFYINSGQLEFKTLSNFERPEDAARMPKPKKRLLSTSSESDSEEGEKEKEKKKKEKMGSAATSGTESATGKSDKAERNRVNGHVGKKQKMANEKLERKLQEKKKKKKEEVKEGGKAEEKEIKVVKTITVKDMLRAKRDSMRKMEQEKKGRSSATVSSSEAEEDGDDEEDDEDEEGSEGSDSDSSGSGSEESESDSASGSEPEPPKVVNGEEEAKKRNEVRLPDNLPDHLLQDLSDLKKIADKSTGKFNFFDTTVADLLLQIDVSSRMCGGSARNAIYKHLEQHLRVSRQTLMVKIKKLRIRKEDNKVKKALDKLEDAVTEMMPKLLTNYEAEKQKAIELRNSLPPGENGEKPEVKYPKKKFPWNDNLRGLLFAIANIRKQSFHILRPRKETEEQFIQGYLRTSVVPLWPSGWVKFEDLQKELDRRKKNDIKAASKETKKTVHLSSASTATLPSQGLANGPGSKPEAAVSSPSVKPSGSKPEEKKTVRLPQSSPVVVMAAAASPSQPPASTSPAATKKTSDHSIINIISSPPSKTSSSQHSSHYQSQQPSPQPPRPQSQPPRHSGNFDEDLIQAHVINLEAAHSASKSSPHPMDYRINSPALSSASSASSSRRQSSYQEQPPMAHSNSTPGNSNANNRKGSKSLDDDSDSSIEIVGEYSMGEKKPDLALNLALPSINKDKYKKIATSGSKGSGSRPSSESGASTSGGFRGSPMNINNNNNNNSFEKKSTKYGHSPSPSPSSSMASVSVLKSNVAGSFALPTSLMQDMKSNALGGVQSRMPSAPGELDVLRIMKELHELQAIQISPSNKPAVAHSGSRNPRGNSPKPTHSFGVKPKQDLMGSASNHQTPKSTAASQQQKQQPAHHSK